MSIFNPELIKSELGKKSEYKTCYDPSLLFPISRDIKRLEIGIDSKVLPFKGYDCWNHYEVSWLNPKGKPMVAIAQIYYDCTSSHIIESKSFKLYFNSFNNTKFESKLILEQHISNDVSKLINSKVIVQLDLLSEIKSDKSLIQTHLIGENIDSLDIECDEYIVNPKLLKLDTDNNIIQETLTSDLLKSNCLVTNQPDWGSIQISYKGKKIDRIGLLKYIISFRNHNEFHEQCIERIFVDILNYCKPEALTVYGRYTRRGGLDINPYRTNKKTEVEYSNIRLIRQ